VSPAIDSQIAFPSSYSVLTENFLLISHKILFFALGLFVLRHPSCEVSSLSIQRQKS
jgi:hypothetical protein